MNVPRGTLATGAVRPLQVRSAVAAAFRAGVKTTHRVQVTHTNSKVEPGKFSGLDLESGRTRRDDVAELSEIRARCNFESGLMRVVTVSPVVKVGDLFWMRPGRERRVASDITLEVVRVHVARLQDMTDGDAIREGAEFLPAKFRTSYSHNGAHTAREWYANNWDYEAGPYNADHLRARWALNPWVWIYGFEVRRQNIDALLEVSR